MPERDTAETHHYAALPDRRMDHVQNRNPQKNHHPTVKPTTLMAWLVRLISQPGDLVLDPFCGSGSTGKACIAEGRSFLGIEQDEAYLAIARARLDAALAETPLFDA